MTRQISVRGVRRSEPKLQLYVLALIALARHLQEQEASKTGAAVTEVASD